jgi:CO/xanthine dehydrogenase Mo-binding subunit
MQYTIRQVPKAVDRAFRAKAKAEGKSLNELAIEALARQAGIDQVALKKPKRDLSFLRMEPDDVKAIREAHEMCDQVDPEAWR